ncbi:hypothetical protein MU1_12000 [Paenibacillus glycanilyticus]|uniref:Uncharacterized protein n=1 Tax=Paenibacillus glycanilyticus TaxID=126569 RepID=A0ABQ6G796_9BACL|nr:hypothetical protein MU1_12000 [Paenibacillus glycanilyticus]
MNRSDFGRQTFRAKSRSSAGNAKNMSNTPVAIPTYSAKMIQPLK